MSGSKWYAETVRIHAEARAACGRAWVCHCGACRTARSDIGKDLAAARWSKAPASDRERLRTLRSKPTPCKKCGEKCASVRASREHCRVRRCPQCLSLWLVREGRACPKCGHCKGM